MNRPFFDRLKALTASGSTQEREVRHAMKIVGFLSVLRRREAQLDSWAREGIRVEKTPNHLLNMGRRERMMKKLFKRRVAGHYKWWDSIKDIEIVWTN